MAVDTLLIGVDHVELFVEDVEVAERWYERVLGLSRAPAFEAWHRTGSGPLMLAVDETTKLALFERDSATRGEHVSPHRVAFQTDAEGFLAFRDRLPDLDHRSIDGDVVSPGDVVDHELTYSVYFQDLDGNRLELTTAEYAAVAASLEDDGVA